MAEITHAPIVAGSRAPDFSRTDEQGHMHRLAEYRGRTLVLCFLPRPEELGGVFPDISQKDVFILGVMAGSPSTVGLARAKHRIPFPLVCDTGTIAADYGLTGKTARYSFFVIAPDGTLKAVYKNLDNPRHLSELLHRA